MNVLCGKFCQGNRLSEENVGICRILLASTLFFIHKTKEVENMDNFENKEFETENIEPEEAVDEVVEEKKKLSGWKKELWDWVQAIVIAVVVSFLLREYVLTLAKVSGESMLPTLEDSDRLYVNRLMYEPEKGDVIIFEPASDPGRPYIKRVIATEGDSVYIDFVKGEVYVNDELLDEPYINDETHLTGTYIETLRSQGNYSKEKPIVVEKDKIFVMGDNRNGSKDSRHIGQVPKSEIIGQALFRFWPLDAIGGLE